MRKIRITESQKQMLESKALAKLKEDINYSQSGAKSVSDEFKSAGANKLEGMKVEGVEGNEEISLSELAPKVLEFLKLLYTNPSKVALDPFWDSVDVSWDELIQLLTELQLIRSVKGGYRLQKLDRVGGPDAVVRIVTKLIHKLINNKRNPIDEIEDDEKQRQMMAMWSNKQKPLKNPLNGQSYEERESHNDIFHDDIFNYKKKLKVIYKNLAKGEEEIGSRSYELLTKRRDEIEHILKNRFNDPNYVQQYDSGIKSMELRKSRMSEIEDEDITGDYFKKQLEPRPKTGKSREELLAVIAQKRKASQKQTADIEAKRDAELRPLGEEDGDNQGIKGMDILNYFPFTELSNSREEGYTRNVSGWGDVQIPSLNGEGLTQIPSKQDMVDFIKGFTNNFGEEPVFTLNPSGVWYDKIKVLNPKFLSHQMAAKDAKSAMVRGIERGMEETDTGALGASPVGKMGGSITKPIHKSNVEPEMNSIISDGEEDTTLKSEIINQLQPFTKQGPDFWLNNEGILKEIVDNMQTLNDDEWVLMVQFIVSALQSAENYIQNNGPISKFTYAINGLSEFVNHFSSYLSEMDSVSVGNIEYDTPPNKNGEDSDFWNAGNKLNKGMPMVKKNVQEMVAREGKNAKTDTQWPGGHFVEFDDCTKLNNNKKAQNGGCSTGAVDGVVKTKSSKNSVISDSSIYETIAKETGRTIDEVKNILKRKNNKSK